MTRIALIHALEESVAPAHAALAGGWPEAFAFDLLDTSLAIDRAQAGTLDPTLFHRLSVLAQYAAGTRGRQGRTAGILFTCSAFGPAIDRVKTELDLPVLRPNESAFREALQHGRSIGLVVSFPPSADALEAELRETIAATGVSVRVETVLADRALEALKAGDGERHDQFVVQAVRELGGVDVLVLGQFSMARAAPAVVADGFAGRVITSPDAAVRDLRRRIESATGGPTKENRRS